MDMRPKEPKHHGHNPAAHHGSLSGADVNIPHLNDSDALTSPWASDLIDGGSPNWEAAWIDIGGEG
jgi:hypothetical protein